MSNTKRYFTKSAFKEALLCPARLNYYHNDGYANQNNSDEFLKALAQGGFQVEELAKIYHEVPPENDLEGLDTSEKTDELMLQENVVMAEATFKWGNCSVRADLIKKHGNQIELIEIKAKSWGGEKNKWINKNGEVDSDIRKYVYDVAFQKYILTNYLKERFPGQSFTVTAALLMADKSKVASEDHINQYFKIVEKDGKTSIEKQPGWEILKDTAVQNRILTVYQEVDALCDSIIDGTSPEQEKYMHGYKFKKFVVEMSDRYVNGKKSFKDCSVTTECFKCPYYATKKDKKENLNIKDGYDECWMELTKNFPKPYKVCDEKLLLESLCGYKTTLLEKGHKIYLDQITQDDLKIKERKNPGLAPNERKKIQIALATGNLDFAGDLAKNIKDGVYLDIAGLKEEMSKWESNMPLHMIDFETSAVALPFYKGRKPYEQIAFQFSHHKIDKDESGNYTIEHATQWINESAEFPNFEFVKQLKDAVGDKGTIFRYATHENTILRTIRQQLEEQKPANYDYNALIAFIDSITHEKGDEVKSETPKRDMIDLCDIVKRYYYDPLMGGSNSIKAVLPAVLQSDFLFKKYSKPIYGSEIKSQNFTEDQPVAWIKEKGENPYKKLDSISKFLPKECEASVNKAENSSEENDFGDSQINNGGAALWAYSLLQFKLQKPEEKKALLEALYRYCELDTLSMVFIWEYFNSEVEG